MEKNTQGLVVIFAILSLLIGFSLGAVLMGEDVEVIKEIVKEVPVNVSVDKVEYISLPSYLDLAVEEFLEAVEDEEVENINGSVDILGNYNFDELEVNKIYDLYNVSYDDEIITVDFKIKLKFDDGDHRLRETYNVKVIFDEEEDTEIEAILA